MARFRRNRRSRRRSSGGGGGFFSRLFRSLKSPVGLVLLAGGMASVFLFPKLGEKVGEVVAKVKGGGNA